MATGQFLLASEHLFLVALVFLIVGNGFFKPNISTQVGNLYAAGDSRRDSAFMIFYMGVNLGAFLSPLICGTLGQKVGWHYGFAAAGIGMVLGLVVYHFGRHLVPHETPSQRQAKVAADAGGLTAAEWKRIGVLCLLCFLNIVFWGIYEQQGNTLQLWADGQTDWNLFGWEMPSTWYQSFNPAFIFIFTPLIVALWKRQAARDREPSTVAKMGMGCVLLGLGYVIMVFAARAFTGDKQNLMWLVTSTWVFTMGELYLSPVGLSMVTKVAPARTVSTMMGVWYLSSFFGNYAAGFFGSFYSVMTKVHFFGLLAIAGIITGCVFFLIRRPVVRVMQTKH
jgi:POT family proton-dependent oligopeptide transporter